MVLFLLICIEEATKGTLFEFAESIIGKVCDQVVPLSVDRYKPTFAVLDHFPI